MTDPAKTVDQNILPVQAYFNLDGTFNTFIGQGQPFVISATESISINNSSVNATLYPTFTSATSGQVTGLAITSSSLTWNPGTGVFSAPTFQGVFNGTANTANNLSGGGAGQIVYQNALGSTAYLPAGSTGQFLLSNGTSAPSWATVATSVTIADQTTDTATYYPLFYSATSGSTNTVETSSTKLQYQPSTGKFTATLFSGSGASLTNIPNGALTNSTVTIGSTAIALGATSTTLAGLTSVTATSFIGALTGNADTATTATNATNSAITDNTSSSGTFYPTLVTTTSGNQPLNTSSTKLSFQPSTSTLTASIFSGAATNIYGGTTNQIAVQSAANTTTFIVAPTVASTVLNWTGSAFSWVAQASGSVTSVAATVPSFLSITGSPITTSGTLAISYSGTALPGANGGTGQTGAFVAGGIVYGSSTTALAVSAVGTTGQVLQSNGTSAPTWVTAPASAAGGSTTQVQYNSSGVLAGSANMTFNGTKLTLANDASINGLTVGTGGGSTNTVVGGSTPNTTSASNNVYIGYQTAIFAGSSASNNVGIGFQALVSTTSNSNVAIGYQAGLNNTSGGVTAVGYLALKANTTGTSNLAFGANSLLTNQTGSNNTAIGSQAGYAITGSNNTLLGSNAGKTGTNDLTTGSNNLLLGFNTQASSATVSNEITIGNSSSKVIRYPHSYSTVANLPAATIGQGSRTFVTDALAPVFQATVTGGGAVFTPVYSNGTNWVVG